MSHARTCKLTPEVKQFIKKDKETFRYQTDFKFLRSHNGLRPGKTSVLMAPPSAGKSTLVRSILRDFCENNPTLKVLVILSEETTDEFWEELAEIDFDFNDKVYALSEIETELDLGPSMVELVTQEEIAAGNYSLIIYDNITTSILYNDKTPAEQQAYILNLERRAHKQNHAFLIVAHTGKKIRNKNFLDVNDIRGTSNLSNRAQFFYILNSCIVEDDIVQFITIEKCRGFNRKAGAYLLDYMLTQRVFKRDSELNRSELKEVRKYQD